MHCNFLAFLKDHLDIPYSFNFYNFCIICQFLFKKALLRFVLRLYKIYKLVIVKQWSLDTVLESWKTCEKCKFLIPTPCLLNQKIWS